VVVLFALDESPSDARWLSAAEREALVSQLDAEGRASGDGRAHHVGEALRHRWLWVLALVYFVVPVALYAFGFFLPQILQAAFKGTPFQIGLLSAIPYLVGAAGMVVAARHSDRTGERRWHVAVCATTAAIAFASVLWFKNPYLSLAALALAFAGTKSTLGPFWALSTEFLTGTAAAGGIALINSVGNLGGFFGPYIVGMIKDKTGSNYAALLFLGSALLGMGLLALTIRPAQARKA
jgi:nitrate/nitrite transporter NarK